MLGVELELELVQRGRWTDLVLSEEGDELLLDPLDLLLLPLVSLRARVDPLDGLLEVLRHLPGLVHELTELSGRARRRVERLGVQRLDLVDRRPQLVQRRPDVSNLD